MVEQVFVVNPEIGAPGEYLKRVLDERNIKIVDFAVRTGRTPKTISEIISGDAPISPETALLIESVLKIPAVTLLGYETSYRLELAKEREERELNELENWLKQFNYNELVQRGFVKKTSDKISRIRELLVFFGYSNQGDWARLGAGFGQQKSVAFRKAKKHASNAAAVDAWLRIGEIRADNIEVATYDAKKFKEALAEIRQLTVKGKLENFKRELEKICAECGVALVIEEELKGARLSGAARWLSKDKPLIQLSTRYKFTDQFWFSFFHEAAHILLHSKKMLFVDEEIEEKVDKIEEIQADEFAQDCLLPSHMLDQFYQQYGKPGSKPAPHNEKNIREFSDKVGLHTGIVFAQMQRRYRALYKSPLNSKLKEAIV